MRQFDGRKRWIYVGVLILGALISYFVIADSTFFTKMNAGTIAYLEEKREDVMILTALSGTVSTAITALPEDIGQPLAENIANVADYLLVVFAGIWVQKYLVSLATGLVFKLIVPISCLLSALNAFWKSERVTSIVTRFLLLGSLLLILVPSSVWLSKYVESTYHYSVDDKIEAVQGAADKVANGESQGLFEAIVGGISNFIGNIKEMFETVLADMMEATVVLIVTSCVIPMLVILLFIWCFNFIFGTSFSAKSAKTNLFGGLIQKRRKSGESKVSNYRNR